MAWIVLLYICVLCGTFTAGLNNGLAKTPPMGWMSWGRYECTIDCKKHPKECISEDLLIRITDELIEGKYDEAGYQYVIVDDCWMKTRRDSDGRLVSDETRFPHGIPSVAKYIHKAGLKFGIYGNYGEQTCKGYAGSKDHEMIDAQTFAEWGADYLKLDGCFTSKEDLDYGYPEFSKQLNNTGHPVVFSCSWPYYLEHVFHEKPDYASVNKFCNLYRTYHDISDSWGSVKAIISYYGKNPRFAKNSGPGHWNDPDMLMIGNSGLNVGQSRIQMAIWSILAAPLIMSNDLSNIQKEMKDILLNLEVIAVDQDPLGVPGRLFKAYGDFKVWKRMVIPVRGKYSSYAYAFVNMNGQGKESIIVSLKELELKNPFGYTIFDLYAQKELANITKYDNLTITVEPMDVLFYKFQVL